MTVGELIEQLKAYPPDVPVLMRDERNDPHMILGLGELHEVVHLATTPWVKPSVILAEHRDEIVSTLASAGLANPRVFGSVLRSTDTPLSDLDVLVDAGSGTTLFDIGRAMEVLRKRFGIRFDIVTPNGLPESFRATVLAEARPL